MYSGWSACAVSVSLRNEMGSARLILPGSLGRRGSPWGGWDKQACSGPLGRCVVLGPSTTTASERGGGVNWTNRTAAKRGNGSIFTAPRGLAIGRCTTLRTRLSNLSSDRRGWLCVAVAQADRSHSNTTRRARRRKLLRLSFSLPIPSPRTRSRYLCGPSDARLLSLHLWPMWTLGRAPPRTGASALFRKVLRSRTTGTA